MINRFLSITVLALGIVAQTVPANAVETFASFLPTSSASNMRWQKVGSNGGELFTISSPTDRFSGSVITRFSFVNSTLSSLGVLDASFAFFATSTNSPASAFAGFFLQPVETGTFSFLYQGVSPLTVNGITYVAGANLLSGAFTGATIFGSVAGTSGSVTDSTPDGTIVYSSDFLTFNASDRDLSLAMTSISPALRRVDVNASIGTFRANVAGSFSTDVPPTLAVVPEPQIWGILVLGFGIVGVTLRRRPSTSLPQKSS